MKRLILKLTHRLWSQQIKRERLLQRANKLIEVYEWLFEHDCSVSRLANELTGGQAWGAYDADGVRICTGRCAEEAAWGAWDAAHNPD